MMAMVRALKRTVKERLDRMEHPDPTPIEVTLDLVRPISSLEDLRRMMKQLSVEAEQQGLESFEEFYDFGEDEAFEDIPAPAQMKHEAVLLARDRDFEGEVIAAKEKYKERLNAEARETLLKQVKDKQAKEAAEEE